MIFSNPRRYRVASGARWAGQGLDLLYGEPDSGVAMPRGVRYGARNRLRANTVSGVIVTAPPQDPRRPQR